MSLNELKNILLKIRDHSYGLISSFYLDGISIKNNIYLKKDGYIYVQSKSGKEKKYTIEKFFIHYAHELSKKDISEAIKRLEDLLLLVKFEEGNLKARDILRCRNIHIRRFLFERIGYEKFVKELKCKTIHKDGENELIMIPLRKNEEPIFLVKVKDPSLQVYYMLRVPPNVRTCKEAIAWTFRLSSEEYNPIMET